MLNPPPPTSPRAMAAVASPKRTIFEGDDPEHVLLDEDELVEVSLWAHRFNWCCSGVCTLIGYCIRALFYTSILAICVLLFFLIVQFAWGVFTSATRKRDGDGGDEGPSQDATSKRYARNDEIAHSFPHCANNRRSLHPFIRNICWRANPSSNGEVGQFAMLISRTLMDLAPSELGRKRLFLIDALYSTSVTRSGVQETVANLPATDGTFSVFRFDSTPGNGGGGAQALFCDVRRETTWSEEAVEEGTLLAMPILKLEDDEVWLDATQFLKSLFFMVRSPAAATQNGGGAYHDTLRVNRVSVFPRNAVVSVEIFTRNLLDASEAPLTQRMDFSLVLLDETPSVAREAHDALGYFTSSIRLDEPRRANAAKRGGGQRLRMINRRKDFVFYIDPSVPAQYREAVKRGAERWNLALLPLGKRIQIILPNSEEWPQDYAVADVRYSTISWSTSITRTFAIGPSTVDPRSGEILNSDIVLTDKWAHSWANEVDFLSPTKSERSANMRACSKQALAKRMLISMEEMSREFIEAGISDVVSHEVGHALGLRHNFKGSLQVPLGKLGDASYLEEYGLTSSVMDYLDLNPHFLNTHLAFPTKIGSYDVAAVRYGYEDLQEEGAAAVVVTTTFGTRVELAIAPRLDEIARGAGEYATDEDFLDPEAAVFDLSNDPLAYLEQRAEDIAKLRQGLVQGSSKMDARRLDLAHRVLSSRLVHIADVASSYLGGKIIRNRAPPPPPSFDFPSLDTQLRALKLVLKLCTGTSNAYFSTANWFKICEEESPACRHEGQIVEVDAAQHAADSKLRILQILLLSNLQEGDAPSLFQARLQRMDEDASPLSATRFLDMMQFALFDSIANAELWDLQREYIARMLRLLHTTSATRVSSLARNALEQVLQQLLSRAARSSPLVAANIALRTEQIKQGLERWSAALP